jgi:hypothetical protein
MTPHNQRKWRKLQNQNRTQRDPKQIFDVLLTLDRMLVEVSKRPYNLAQQERFSVPAQPATARCCETAPAPAPETFKPSALASSQLAAVSRFPASPLHRHRTSDRISPR